MTVLFFFRQRKTSNLSTRCFTCQEKTTTYSCPGCENYFCVDDLIKHREELKSQFHQIEQQTNEYVKTLNDQQKTKTIPNNHPAIIQINLWEQKSIEKIKQTAEQQRQFVQQSIHECLPQIQTQFNHFTQQIQQINKKKDFNEKVLQKLQIRLKQIQQPMNIEIKQDSSSTFIQKLSIQISHSQHQLKSNLKWKQYAQTIAGGNREGDKLTQLFLPHAIYVDHHQQQQHMYIADYGNNRIVKWKLGENEGQIVAGGNGRGSRIDQLNSPLDVIVDEKKKSLIICDHGNRRVVRWPLPNPNGEKEILIENIWCYGLMMNQNGDLFVCDWENHAVKRWKRGELGKEGTIVAGGNGRGNKLNQLNGPTYIFIDREETIYVSDTQNDRVMKWLKGVREGIIVAGGQGQGNSLNQLFRPQGLVVNEIGDIYVTDHFNQRIMCWSLGSKEGRVVVGGNGCGNGSNQLNNPSNLLFDVENNLYVIDYGNHRIQRFNVDTVKTSELFIE